MPTRLITPPAVEPVSIEEMRAYLRITSLGEAAVQEDRLLAGMIESARLDVESITGRGLILQTWEMAMNSFPSGSGDDAPIELNPSPLYTPPITEEVPNPSCIVSMSYRDIDGAWQTVSDYDVDTWSEPGAIYPLQGSQWPATSARRNSVLIRYLVGYGTRGIDVPEPLRAAIRRRVGNGYEYRENVMLGAMRTMDDAEQLAPYMLIQLQ